MTTTTTTPDLKTILGKLNRWHDEVAAEVFERETEIHGSIVALVSGTHVFFLGTKGVAKSLTVERLVARIKDPEYFYLLFGAHTGPDEVFGPLNLSAYEQGHYERIIDGYLPTTRIFFGDEHWKGGASFINGLLNAYNERRYKHDGKNIKIPLNTAFLASNELPQDESLEAIYDRIAQRFVVKPIQEAANFVAMLQSEIPAAEDVEKFLTWDEIDFVQAHIKTIPVPQNVLETMHEISRAVRAKNIEPSDRRFKHAIRIIQAEALLDGCDVVEMDHLSALIHVLWDEPEQIADVTQIVLDRANPLLKEFMDLLEDVNSISDLLPQAKAAQEEDDRQAMAMECHRKLRRAAEQFRALKVKPGADSKKNAGTLTSCRSQIKGLAQETHDLFGVSGTPTIDL